MADMTRGADWSPKGIAAFIRDMQSDEAEAVRQAHRDAAKAHKAKKKGVHGASTVVK